MNDFIRNMVKQASEAPQRICFAESQNAEVLKTAAEVVRTGIGTPVIVGKQAEVEAFAAENGIFTEKFEYFDNTSEEERQKIADEYTSRYDEFSLKAVLRKTKKSVPCAMFLLKLGKVDCVAAGKECPTGDVIIDAISIVGLADGIESPSSLGIADIPDFNGPQGHMLGLADCAVTARPDAAALAGIAIASADTVKDLLGWEPRAAMLAFSTTGSAEDDSIDVVRAAVDKVHELRPDIKCDGEFQLDAAIIPKVAAHKVKRESDVAGKANILIFPNLHAGNIGVKMIQIFGHANAYGPVLQGFRQPVCDFSRSAPVEEMLGNVAMLAIRAAKAKKA